jgi:hypothetical protein
MGPLEIYMYVDRIIEKEVIKEVEKLVEVPKYIDRPVYTTQI